jgi:methylenetetrahydrofolate reductase (NADPH)
MSVSAAHLDTSSTPSVSFEFFPPANDAAAREFWAAIRRLEPLEPAFVSVTCGADGSNRDRTESAVLGVNRKTTLTAVPHLTCVGARRAEILSVARRYWGRGVRHLVALRGDPPAGTNRYLPAPGGFAYASDLVAGLRDFADFEISVAGYPERHPQSRSWREELTCLKAKCDAGATRIITQFFFEPALFLRFRDRCVAAGIRTPVVPGILPVTRLSQLQRFAARCGASIPAWLVERFEGLDDDLETRQMLSACTAIKLVTRLIEEGAEHLHFYTLNRSALTFTICHALGIRSRSTRSARAAGIPARQTEPAMLR